MKQRKVQSMRCLFFSANRFKKVNNMHPAPLPSRAPAYATLAITLHWMLAILIIGMTGLGWYMMSIEDDPGSAWYFNLHKSIGVVIVALVVVRLLWRLNHKPSALPASMPSWQLMASKIGHRLLYAAMLAMPFFGIVGTMLSEDDTQIFGLLMPRMLHANHDMAEIFFNAHSITAWFFVSLIVAHALAGFKHLLVDKDGVFQRMWFS